LVLGATGGLGRALVDMLVEGSDCTIGAHGDTQAYDANGDSRVVPLKARLESEADCIGVIDRFREVVGGIDALVMLAGRLTATEHWDRLSEEEWRDDIHLNLNIPFFAARAALGCMKVQGGGGRIILNGTESALHGGSPQSFPYAVAKRGTEALVQGLARDGAPHGVLINGVRLGYIASGFHERWSGRDETQMTERAQLVPLKRGGNPQEAAALIVYLLSGWARFMTGQMVALTGGDWL
jgi:NAD(P)-dependent dehydrogenase (short-subunit alcohol dehydrogenase family)